MITTGRKKNGMERWNAVWKNISITAGILAAASGFTLLLNSFVNSDSHVPAVVCTGNFVYFPFYGRYIYGIVAAIAAVIEVNYIFTYPYFEFNFTITGYPLTFVTMLAVSFERQCPDHSDQAAGTDPAGSGKREDAGKSHAGGFP